MNDCRPNSTGERIERFARGNAARVARWWVGALLVGLATGAHGAMGQADDRFESQRDRMVDEEIVAAGVKNEAVISAMRATPRHEFVPVNARMNAYLDMALPIGHRQTISPPFVVAYMTQQLDPQPNDKVLEIGTGSGYQAAILSPLVKEVYSIEIVEELGRRAARTLRRLDYKNVTTKIGDGFLGWPEHAPFDKIIVTCSPERVPRTLVDQLREGGRMVIPLGERYQQILYLYSKRDGQLVREALLPTLFVPMTGEAESRRVRLPDATNPAIVNGGFERFTGQGRKADSWHYQRQMEIVADQSAPAGEHCAIFVNEVPGRTSHALQGFAIDGRGVREIEVSVWVRCRDVKPGQDRSQLPMLAIGYYDGKRDSAGQVVLGPWTGNIDWQMTSQRVRVPLAAREAILRVGLFGATGEISVDDIEITVTRRAVR